MRRNERKCFLTLIYRYLVDPPNLVRSVPGQESDRGRCHSVGVSVGGRPVLFERNHLVALAPGAAAAVQKELVLIWKR